VVLACCLGASFYRAESAQGRDLAVLAAAVLRRRMEAAAEVETADNAQNLAAAATATVVRESCITAAGQPDTGIIGEESVCQAGYARCVMDSSSGGAELGQEHEAHSQAAWRSMDGAGQDSVSARGRSSGKVKAKGRAKAKARGLRVLDVMAASGVRGSRYILQARQGCGSFKMQGVCARFECMVDA
jgi:tRNA G26 N,N-dimethylase Trm1